MRALGSAFGEPGPEVEVQELLAVLRCSPWAEAGRVIVS